MAEEKEELSMNSASIIHILNFPSHSSDPADLTYLHIVLKQGWIVVSV